MIKDKMTANIDGSIIETVPEGVFFHEIPTKVDDRGSLIEMYNPAWDLFDSPPCYTYCVTIRTGKIKGWALHKEHSDRYCILFGEMKVVLFDDRPESSTYQMVSEVVLSEYNRRIMEIPPGIWHADQNIGSKDVFMVNFPTLPYDHANPDKYRLPLDTDKIPYKFKDSLGW